MLIASVKPEDSVLRETSRPQEDQYRMILLCEVLRAVESTDSGQRWLPGAKGAGGWGNGG